MTRWFILPIVALAGCAGNGTSPASVSDAAITADSGSLDSADVADAGSGEDAIHPSGGVVMTLMFQPPDLSTAVGAVTPRIELGETASSASIVDDATLVTWPELAPVAVTKIAKGTAIDLVPITALADRWYAIRLSKGVPPLYERSWWLKTLSDGSVVVRFRTGSEPIVTQVQLGAKGGSVYSIGIDMSEPVAAPAGTEAATMVDAVTGGSLGCTQSGAEDFAVKTFFVRCTALAAEVKLTMSPALKTAAGVAVAQTHRFKPAGLPNACGTDCVVFRP